MTPTKIAGLLLTAIGLWLVALLGAGCTDGGPTGHRITCRDYPSNSPIASTCEAD